jgi:cation transport regulator ChaB
MPYSNISELPQSVREAVPSYAGRAMFRAVVNSQLSAGKTESVAFASAWAALQRAGYEKAESGEWIKKAESYDAPDSARNNARKAIAWREKYGDDVKGGTIVGWTRASQLASGEKLSLSTVKRMAMFNRHRSNSEVAPEYKGEPWKDAGHVAWLLWGGTSGVDWARGISGRVEKREAVPLYGCRPLLNAQDLIDWAKSKGYVTTLEPDDMHVTIVYSRTPLPMPNTDGEATWGLGTVVVRGGNRSMMSLGDGSASALVIDSVDLISEWNHYRSMGASWDWPSYMPHVTISYAGGPVDIEPYTGDLVFGPIQFEQITGGASDDYVEKRQYNDDVFTDRLGAMSRSVDLGLDGYVHCVMIEGQAMFRPGEDESDYVEAVYGEIDDEYEKQDLLDAAIRAILQTVMDNETHYSSSVKIIKMDDEQRVVWGWASVATEDGKAVFDVHGDHIPMSELTKASIDFMENVRVGKSLHQGEQTSSVIGCLPLSQELAKALGIETTREGLIMGFRVHDDATWGLIKSGELPALSIGGRGRKYAV